MSYIKPEYIDSLFDKVDIVTVISDFVDLKKNGANFKGLSPFVDEKTPSFIVSPVKEIFKDFSSGKGGNVVTFLMELKNFNYPEAIEYLAGKFGMPIEYAKPEIAEQIQKEESKKEVLRTVLESIHKLYVAELKKLPKDHPAYLEINKRKYNQDVIDHWGIGYAPSNFLFDKLQNSGKTKEGEALGLIKQGNFNNKYDLYSNRLIYPIRDIRGNLIGFAGRQLDDKKAAKWINPPVDNSNILYKKSKTWFGLNTAVKRARERKEIWIVEGYNDVIAFQDNGLLNTVSSSGTAIAPDQVQILAKHVERVNLVLDPDAAGVRAMLKYIPEFLKEGLRVNVITLPDLDPDDFCRYYQKSLDEYGLESMLKEPDTGIKKEGFLCLMENNLVGDAIEKSKAAQELAKIVGLIPDETIRRHYTKWLASETKEPVKKVEEWVATVTDNNTTADNYYEYELPDGVDVKLADVIDDIRFYGLFMAKNQIYFAQSKTKDGIVRFSTTSNFKIEYLMHIRDEKYPKKLVRVKNIFNEEMVFDTNSDNLNTLQSFYNTLTGNGNFRFDGNNNDLKDLNKYLMDKMGSGTKIDVLGWQNDGFWVWNNQVVDESGVPIEMTPDGIIVFNNKHYYVPSANKIYKDIRKKYKAQKQFRVIDNPIPFTTYLNKVREVHNDHSISAILFAIASLFLDIIEDEIGRFPLLFLYGPGGSGKDELANIVQSFVGIPQEAINLEGGVSTAKAHIREFAQFRNGISQLSEYKKGDQKLDGMLKGLWDRRGYKKGNIESDISTDTVDIESAVILTGNEYPTTDALISRLLSTEMIKNEFTEAEGRSFNELKDMTEKGVSGYANDLLKHRKMFRAQFSTNQRLWKSALQADMPSTLGRIVLNYSIVASVYTLFKDIIVFPFSQQEMVNYFKECSERQMRKINSGSLTSRFFEMFIASLRGSKDDRLQVNQVVAIEGTMLFFNWSHTYSKIQRMWYMHYQEAAPSNTSLLSALEKSNVLSGKKKAHTFSPGANGVRTSAVMIELSNLPEEVSNDITGSIFAQQFQYQSSMGQTAMPFGSPATPDEETIF